MNENIDYPLENEFSEEEQQSQNSSPKEESRFKEGQILTFVRVRFPGNARSFPFLMGKRKFSYGQKVLAMSDRGMAVGYVNSFPYERPFEKSMLPLRAISKAADEEDLRAQKENAANEKRAENTCLRLIDEQKLDMTITHVEFIHFGKKAVFYFVAPERVDFRDLVKGLVAELKMRIELRQISVRDRTAALGSIGACGLQTCCSSFLTQYGNVGIKMAKNQNLALIPSKINGVCGQLKCCIRFEDDIYTEKRKKLPKEGEFIEVKNGDRGKVQKLDILVEQFEMLTDKGERRVYTASMYTQGTRPPEGWKFPERFENILNETHKVIGQETLPLKENKESSNFKAHQNELEDETIDNKNDLENEEEIDNDNEFSDESDEDSSNSENDDDE